MLAMHAACGRIGFEPDTDAGDGGIDPTMIVVTVHGQAGDLEEGQAIANATVVFAGADVQVRTTDDAGITSAVVGGATTIHVGYMVAGTWRYYTISDVVGGSNVVIGSQARPETFVTVGLDLPAFATATRYELVGPTRCEISGGGPTTQATSTIKNCTGETVPLHVIAHSDTDPLAWLDAGVFAAVDGAAYSTTAPWQSLTTTRVSYPGVPSSVTITSGLASESGANRIILGQASTAVTAGDHEDLISMIGGSVDVIEVGYGGPGFAALGIMSEPAPSPIAGVRQVDTSRLMRIVDTVMQTGTGIEWTFLSMPRPATLIYSELQYTSALGEPVKWTVVMPGDATRVEVPTLPAPLDALTADGAPTEGFIATFASGTLGYDAIAPGILGPVGIGGLSGDHLPVGSAVGISTFGMTARTVRSRLERQFRALSGGD